MQISQDNIQIGSTNIYDEVEMIDNNTYRILCSNENGEFWVYFTTKELEREAHNRGYLVSNVSYFSDPDKEVIEEITFDQLQEENPLYVDGLIQELTIERLNLHLVEKVRELEKQLYKLTNPQVMEVIYQSKINDNPYVNTQYCSIGKQYKRA